MAILPIQNIEDPTWQSLSFPFSAPLPYKETHLPNAECWPDGKQGHSRARLQEQWKAREANCKPSSLPNAMIRKDIKLIREKLLQREEKPGEWIKEITLKTDLRPARAQIIDEEFKADRLIPMKDGSYGLCYSCGEFCRVDLLTAEHVQPQNSTNYSIIERQKRFLGEFSKITDEQRQEILEKTRAREYIIVVDMSQRVTKKDTVIGLPLNGEKLPKDAALKINEFFLRSYLNDLSNLICMCAPCNTKTFHKSMDEKLRQYPLLTHEKAERAFNFSLEQIDIMYTSSEKKEGLGHTIVHWVSSNLFDFLKKQFIVGRINYIPLTPHQEEVKRQLIESSPEKLKGQVEENIESVIHGMKEMGISEKAVQEFLLKQWKGPKAKRELFQEFE